MITTLPIFLLLRLTFWFEGVGDRVLGSLFDCRHFAAITIYEGLWICVLGLGWSETCLAVDVGCEFPGSLFLPFNFSGDR